MHYNISYGKGWTEYQKSLFLDTLVKETGLPLWNRYTNPDENDGHSPYIEYDDDEVRIRRLTHLTKEKRADIIKLADKSFNFVTTSSVNESLMQLEKEGKLRWNNGGVELTDKGLIEAEELCKRFDDKDKEIMNRLLKQVKDNRILDIYQEQTLLENMETYNYIRFKVAFDKFKRIEENNPKRNQQFINHIDNSIKKVKIFSINEKQKKFLVMGKVKKNMEIKLPHKIMFLDLAFTKEELREYGIEINSEELIGLLVTQGYIYNSKDDEEVQRAGTDIPEKSIGESVRLTQLLKYKDEKGMDRLQFETFSTHIIFKDKSDEHKKMLEQETKDKVAHDFWINFFCNVIRFVNFPEIKFREHKKTEKNIQRRIKQGRPIIPDYITVELTGILEKYVDEINEKPKTSWHYNYCFDVKGFYRHLTSPRYKNARTIWVEPFQKGEGRYVPSLYKVKKRKKNDN